MARAALGLSRDDLAEAAGLGGSTVVRFEGGVAVARESVTAMQAALEAAGVEFIPAGATIRAGGGAAGPGVRLRG
ncbi:XRE family transcriptional regulator [Sphingomonas sp. MA1305]|nr:XRE family transcriptional regulator [Sphingomonas sp. MA1305]